MEHTGSIRILCKPSPGPAFSTTVRVNWNIGILFYLPSYFKRGNFYGLSCFENMKVENEKERGARMKSIGVLAQSYSLLHLYKPFLQKQVRYVCASVPNSFGAIMLYRDTVS